MSKKVFTERICCRLSREEMQQVRILAKASHMSVSEYIRNRIEGLHRTLELIGRVEYTVGKMENSKAKMDENLELLFSPMHLVMWRELAGACGVTPSAYLRLLIKDHITRLERKGEVHNALYKHISKSVE